MDISCSSEDHAETAPPETESKYIVFDSCIHLKYFVGSALLAVQLLSCTKVTTGSMLTVKMVCSEGHQVEWHSQPVVADMSAGNLQLQFFFLEERMVNFEV